MKRPTERILMKTNTLARTTTVVVSLHLAILSFLFGERHIAYILVTTASATVIWGVVFFLDRRRRKPAIALGVLLAALIQQLAYSVWKPELGGFWWPLTQSASLQFLIACWIGSAAE